jgi:hypothetical protein
LWRNVKDKSASAYLFWKDCPCGPWQNHQPNPAKVLNEGCIMIIKGIKDLIRMIKFTGVTINIGFIGLYFAGGSFNVNMFGAYC